jgi:AcrR family transcriptional regulator
VARLPAHLSKAPVGRERLSRQALGELQRERILVAATEVFAKRGYQASTVDNIVSAAEMGVGSFYAHFGGKEDCLLEAYDVIVGEAREEIAAAIPLDAPWSQQACALLQELLGQIAVEPLRARLALVEVQTGGPKALRRYGETLDEAVELLRRGRAAGSAEPELPSTFEEATVCGVVWLLHQRLVRGEVSGIEQLLPEVAELLLEPLLGAEKTREEIKLFAQGAGPDDRRREPSV